jgi:hypothetical protein
MIQRIKIKNESFTTPVLVAVIAFFMTVFTAHAATYYSRNSANWNVNSTWSTTGYGGGAAAGYPGINDTAKIGNTYTITVNTNSSCAQLDIGQGISGIVQFSSASTYSLTVGGNVTVNAGASIIYNSNSSRTHTLLIGGNFTNNGTVDLYYDANDIVNTTFNGAANAIVSGSGTWSLNTVTVNKSASTATLDVQVSAFETAIVTLTATTGTYIHNNSGSYSVNSSVASDFAINQNMVFKVPQGTVWFSPNSNRTYLYGSLYVSGGNVLVGSTAGNNGMRYDKVGTNVPYLEITSGNLTVYGGISYASGAGTNPFSFKMTGGTILLNSGTSGTSVEAFLVNDAPSSVFYMTGGTITIQDHNSSPGKNNADWGICGTNGTVTTTGGTVVFGNSSTPTGTAFDFTPNPNVDQPNFKVTGTVAAAITLQPSKSATEDFKLLSLYIDTNKTFDVQSIQGVPGNSKAMSLTRTFDGVYAFYSRGTLTDRSGSVILQGTSAQSIGGTVSPSFYNLTISNPAGVTLQVASSVTSFLTMSSGILLTTATKIITCTSSADANIGSSTSYVNGPMIQTVATSSLATRNFPLGKGGTYRPAILTVNHSNGTSVTYTGEMFNSSAAALGYALPSTINKVSNTRYWNFDRQNVANLTSATMTLYYDVDDSVSNKSRVAVLHDNGSARWVDNGGTGSANFTGNITSSAITSFKTKFSLGFPPAPLPVELLSFSAKKSTNEVLCDWETASEINNNYFTIERSADGHEWSSIGTITGAGNSTVYNSYKFNDRKPLTGDSYYRLKQTDFDGTSRYSAIEHIFFKNKSNEFICYPNPSDGIVHIKKSKELMTGINAVVQDMNGKQIAANFSLSDDNSELTIDFSQAPGASSSSYVINLVEAGITTREKVIVKQ